jgi:hypothetical protein
MASAAAVDRDGGIVMLRAACLVAMVNVRNCKFICAVVTVAIEEADCYIPH